MEDAGTRDSPVAVESEDEDYRDLDVATPASLPFEALPWPVLLRHRVQRRLRGGTSFQWWVLSVALFGLFAVNFTFTILAVSIPTIAEDFGSTTATVSWVVTGPILVFGVAGPSAGKAGDIWGHRRAYLVGLVLTAVFAGFIAISWNALSLIAFRALSALGGASAGPSAMAIINSVFPPERRVQAMGYWSLVMAGAPVMGIICGGVIVENYSWRWIFVFQVPITVLTLLLAALVLPETRRQRDVQFDVAGALTLAVAITSMLIAINRAPVLGWLSPAVLGFAAVCPVATVLFVRSQRRSEHPLVPLRYFGLPNFTFPSLIQAFAQFGYMGGFILTPLLLDEIYGYGANRVGLLSIPRPLAFSIAGPIVGYVAMRVGERVTTVSGVAVLSGSLGMMAFAALEPSDALIATALFISGAGLGFASPSMAAVVANAVEERDFGIAGATLQMVGQIGVVIGIQVMQSIQLGLAPEKPTCLEAADPCPTPETYLDGLAESYAISYTVAAGVAAVAVVFALFIRSSEPARDPVSP